MMINTVILSLLFALSVRGNFPKDDTFTIQFYVEDTNPPSKLPGGVSNDVVPTGLANQAGRRLNYTAQALPADDGARVLVAFTDGYSNTPRPIAILKAAEANELLLVTAKSQNGKGQHVFNEFPVDIILYDDEYYALDKADKQVG